MVMCKETIIRPSRFDNDTNDLVFANILKLEITLVDKLSQRVYFGETSGSFCVHLDDNKTIEVNKLRYRTYVVALVIENLGHVHSKCVCGLSSLRLNRFESGVVCKFISVIIIIGPYRVLRLDVEFKEEQMQTSDKSVNLSYFASQIFWLLIILRLFVNKLVNTV